MASDEMNPIPGRRTIEKWIAGRTVSTDWLVAELEEWADYWRRECGRPLRRVEER